MYLSFAAGSMLGAAFLHMMPEAVRMGLPRTIWWSAAGLLALFFLERFFAFHHHEGLRTQQSRARRIRTSTPRVWGTRLVW